MGGGGLSGGGPGIIGGGGDGGDGFGGGGVKSGWRSPQSMQSCPPAVIAIAVARVHTIVDAQARRAGWRGRYVCRASAARAAIVAVAAKLAVGVLRAQPTIIAIAVARQEARVGAQSRSRWWRRHRIPAAAIAAILAVRAKVEELRARTTI
eukprot:2731677-Prymnesium_polylepis.1